MQLLMQLELYISNLSIKRHVLLAYRKLDVRSLQFRFATDLLEFLQLQIRATTGVNFLYLHIITLHACVIRNPYLPLLLSLDCLL